MYSVKSAFIIVLLTGISFLLPIILMLDYTDELDFIISILKIREKKAKSFIKSPYRFYKFFRPKVKYIDKKSFNKAIESALFYLHELCKKSKCDISYECYVKYISDICKYLDLYIKRAKLDNDTKLSDDEYRDYISAYTRRRVLDSILLEASDISVLKDHEKEFIRFLYSLKPKSYSPITKKDYDNYPNYDKILNSRDDSDESHFVYNILLLEKKVCGEESRILLGCN